MCIQDLTSDLAEAFGVASASGAVIASVVSESPAQAAGLRDGDIVVAVNGAPIRNAAALRGKIGSHSAGETVSVEFLRDGELRTVEVRLGASVAEGGPSQAIDPRLAGVVVGPIPPDTPAYEDLEGVLVVAVDPQSTAFAAGLREADVITSVNRNPVRTADDLSGASAPENGKLLLHVRRGEGALFIAVG